MLARLKRKARVKPPDAMTELWKVLALLRRPGSAPNSVPIDVIEQRAKSRLGRLRRVKWSPERDRAIAQLESFLSEFLAKNRS